MELEEVVNFWIECAKEFEEKHPHFRVNFILCTIKIINCKNKIYKDINNFIPLFEKEYQQLGDKYIDERRIVGWDMVAEENHSVLLDDLELIEFLLSTAINMNNNHKLNPNINIPSS